MLSFGRGIVSIGRVAESVAATIKSGGVNPYIKMF